MAFAPRHIAPIDTKPGTAVGINIPFNAPGVFASTYSTKDAAKANLLNFLLTERGERYCNPSFGGGLRSFIFEQAAEGSFEGLKEQLSASIRSNIPSITLDQVRVTRQGDTNTITVEISYKNNLTDIADNIVISFN